MNVIKNNRGSALALSMGLMMFLSLLAACLLFYVQTLAVVKLVRNEAQLMLDTYTVKQSNIRNPSVKSGHDYTNTIDMNMWLKDFYRELGIDDNLIGYDGHKRIRFQILNPQATYVIDSQIKTRVTFTMRVPYYMAGVKLFNSDIPLSIESHYYLKY